VPDDDRSELPLDLRAEGARRSKWSRGRFFGWPTFLGSLALLAGIFATFERAIVTTEGRMNAQGPEVAVAHDEPFSGQPADIMGLARIMPRGDVAVVAAPFGAGDARIEEVLVMIGDQVERRAPLARLDNYAALESAMVFAETQVAVRQAQLAQIRHEIAVSRAESEVALAQARATAMAAESDLDRTAALVERGVATDTILAAANLVAHEANLAVSQAEATLARYGSNALEDQPDVLVAAHEVAAAEAALRRARVDLERSVVRAPITGTILDIHVTRGQRPTEAGIMEVGDTSRMMAEVEIWQDRIAKVSPGQPVEIFADALGRSLHGHVETIGLTVGRQGVVSDDVAANADARVVRVLVVLDAESSRIASGYTNLEAVARIIAAPRAIASR